MQNGFCEFCGQEKEFTGPGTSFHGPYCEECTKLSLAQDKDALHAIRDEKKASHKK